MPSFPLPEFDFNGTIPQPTDVPSNSQGQLLGNNASNVSIWQVDHIGFNTTGSGYHQQIRMPNFTLASITVPPPVIAGFGGLYCDNTSSTGASTETGLWYTPDASGALMPSQKYQLTRTITGQFATFGTNTNYVAPTTTLGGWTFLPGGLILMYGSIISTGSNTTVNFPFTFPNAVFSINITRTIGVSFSSIGVQSLNTASFVFANSPAITGVRLYWTAIGN